MLVLITQEERCVLVARHHSAPLLDRKTLGLFLALVPRPSDCRPLGFPIERLLIMSGASLGLATVGKSDVEGWLL
jgi:hypothetical protein